MGKIPTNLAPKTFRARLTWMFVVLVGLIAFVALLAHRAWSQAVAVREHFRVVQKESVQLADQMRSLVQELDADVLRFRLHREPALAQEFVRDATTLQNWLAAERQAPHTAAERGVLDAIDAALADYLLIARRFIAEGDEDLLGTHNQRVEALLALGFALAEAHNASLDDTLAGADRAVSHVEWSIYVSLGLLVAVIAGASMLLFRDYVRPLQRTLQESRRQLEHQEKLAALGVLSAGIAHEIRNPLTAVKARVFTLRKAVRDQAAAQEDVDVIDGEVDRLERIVRTFLKFARPPEPELAPVDPIALLRHVRDLVGNQWAASQVRIELDETRAPAMHADRDLLQQALLNLVQNAAEAMSKGGVVRLRAVEAPARDGRFVRLEVADSGPGIAPDAQKRLFDPFFTTKSGGTGLGLALTARILEKHGGSIRFTTSPETGTTFVLIVPVAPVA